jgi:tripartite-type tricarboxylate transporter receptor subunit TctC
MKDMGFDPIKDLSPITLALVVPNVLVVTPSFPAKDFAELIALAKAKPGTVNFASVGVGSSPHLQGEMLKRMANIDIVHVAYKGAGPALQDLVGGQVQMMFDNLPSVLPMIQSGKLRALAVTSGKPAPLLPDVPPIADTLKGFNASPMNYIAARSGTPRPIIARLNSEINAVLKLPDVRERLVGLGITPQGSTPEELEAEIRREQVKWKKVIEISGAKAE